MSSYGCYESLGIVISVCVGFLYIENSNSSSLQCIVRSRKLVEPCSSFSIVNFIVGCSLLNSFKVCSMFVLVWS
jgi:hypothetical protein